MTWGDFLAVLFGAFMIAWVGMYTIWLLSRLMRLWRWWQMRGQPSDGGER